MVTNICKHNQKGFCKFGQQCRNRHEKEICGKSDCDQVDCEKRHPQPCRFFMIYEFCKFGDECAYLHKVRSETLKIRELVDRIVASEEKIRYLETLMKQQVD